MTLQDHPDPFIVDDRCHDCRVAPHAVGRWRCHSCQAAHEARLETDRARREALVEQGRQSTTRKVPE